MRKDAGFDVTDKIIINFTGSENFIKAINNFKQYISTETLAEKLTEKNKTEEDLLRNLKLANLIVQLTSKRYKL